MSTGKTRYAIGVELRVANSASATTPSSNAPTSSRRERDQPFGSGAYHARASGTTSSAPEASPSHQVRQTVGSLSKPITLPERSDVAPIVALTAAPAAIETAIMPTPRTLASGDPCRTRRRSRSVAITTSSTLPQVCPSAEPNGRTE